MLPVTKSRNPHIPNTVREEVVQISAHISSTNTSQQKPVVSSTMQELQPPKTPMKQLESRSSGIPTLQVWPATGASGSLGSSAGS